MYKSNCVSSFGFRASPLQVEYSYNGLQEVSFCASHYPSYRPWSWYELIFQQECSCGDHEIAALPSEVRSNSAKCDFLEPIKTDLLENLFENECGDTVGLLSIYYKHLSKDL